WQRSVRLPRASPARAALRRSSSVLWRVARGCCRRGADVSKERFMIRRTTSTLALAAAGLAVALHAQAPAPQAQSAKTVSLAGETVGNPPTTFEPIVGTWNVIEDGGEKVIMLDGRPWVASKDNPTRLLVANARRMY